MAVGVDQPPPSHPVGAQEAPVSIDCRPPVAQAAGLSQGGKILLVSGWGSEKIARARAIRIFGIFKSHHFPIWGLMAQCEQTTLYFDVTSEDEQAGFIDLSSSMTSANRVQYHQVAGNGRPKCFRVRVRAIKGDITFSGLSKQFMICNAVKQTCAGWKAQLKHAGVKMSNLSPAGRRARFGLSRFQINENSRIEFGVADPVFELSDLNLKARTAPGGPFHFTTYNSTDGEDAVSVSQYAAAAPDAFKMAANQVTQVTVTDGAGTETNLPLVMTGVSPTEFSVLKNYMDARRQSPSFSEDTPGPDGHSQMLNLFSVAEELSDDIVEGIEHYMDYKPYTPDHTNNVYSDPVELGRVSSSTSGTVPAGAGATTSSHYPMVDDIIDVPLGLLQIAADSASCNIQVDVLAIYEM